METKEKEKEKEKEKKRFCDILVVPKLPNFHVLVF
jgi:hypothetical protein